MKKIFCYISLFIILHVGKVYGDEESLDQPLDAVPFKEPHMNNKDFEPFPDSLPFFSYLNTMLSRGNGFYYGTQVAYTPYYTNGQVGEEHSHLHNSTDDVFMVSRLEVTREENDTVAGRVYVGYRVDKYLSIEDRLSKYPAGDSINSVMTGSEIAYGDTVNRPHRHSEELLAKVDLPMNDKLDVYMKGGPAYVYAEYNKALPYDSLDMDYNGSLYEEDTKRTVKHLYGLGSSFKFSDNFTGDISRVLILGFHNENYAMTNIGFSLIAE